MSFILCTLLNGPRALLLLDCQERMLDFLWAMVKKGLRPKRQLRGEKRLLELVGIRLCTAQEHISNFNTTSRHLSPPVFDSTKILEIARSWESAAQNELPCLQVYPDCFGAHTQIFAKRISTPEMGKLKSRIFHSFTWPVIYSMMWSIITDAATRVYQQSEVYKGKILYGRPLPPEYEAALQTLDILDRLLTSLCIQRIRMEMPEYAGKRFQCADRSAQKLFEEDRLEWALRFLCNDVQRDISVSAILLNLERFREENPNHTLRASSTLMNLLTTMSACHHVGKYFDIMNHSTVSEGAVLISCRTLIGCAQSWGSERRMFFETVNLSFWDKMLDHTTSLETVAVYLHDKSTFAKQKGPRDLQWLQAEDAKQAALDDAWQNYLECFTEIHYRQMAIRKFDTSPQFASCSVAYTISLHQPTSNSFARRGDELWLVTLNGSSSSK